MASNGDFPPDQFSGYTDAKNFDSPIGTLQRGLHTHSSEVRCLKIVRPELARHPVFMNWYVSAITLAGEAAENLRMPTLVGPMRTPGGEWVSERNGKHVVERQYFGTDDRPAWNLNEFLQQFRKSGRGVNEDVALAILSLVAEVLGRMHDSKMTSTQGIQFESIPHMNLKPQNILIGKDPRLLEYQVRLTDFLVPMAYPLVERAGARVPLNYSSAKVLESDGYFGCDADIFSCGLILYRLLEAKDLVPADLRRQSVIDFIHRELSGKVHELQLSEARPRTKSIIQRCLTENQTDKYKSVHQLKADIDAALGRKDPATIISDFIALSQKPEVPKKEPTDWKKILKIAGAVALISTVVFCVYLIIDYQNKQEVEEARETVLGKIDDIRKSERDVSCAKVTLSTRSNKIIANAENYLAGEDLELELLDVYDERLSDLHGDWSTFKKRCEDLEKLTQRYDSLAGTLDSMPESIRSLGDRFDSVTESARADLEKLRSSDYVSNFRYGRAIKDTLRSFVVDRIPPTEQEPILRAWSCNPSALNEISEWVSKFDDPCIAHGQDLYSLARVACEENDSAKFLQAYQELKGLKNKQDCKKVNWAYLLGLMTKRLKSLNEDCRSQCQELISAAEIARDNKDKTSFWRNYRKSKTLAEDGNCQLNPCQGAADSVALAEKMIADFRTNHGDSLSSACINLSDAEQGLTRAREFLGDNNCTSAGWNAGVVISLINGAVDNLNVRQNVLHELDQVRELCGDQLSSYQVQLDSISNYMANCDYQSAEAVAITLKGMLDCGSDHITFEDCSSRFSKHDDSSFYYCELVPPPPVTQSFYYKQAQKLFLVSALRAGSYGLRYRTRLARAYEAAEIGPEAQTENAAATITMVLAYGWDRVDADWGKAWDFFLKARRYGHTVDATGEWWKALLVAVRCQYSNWEEDPQDSQRKFRLQEVINDFLDYVQTRTITDIDSYVNEVQEYDNKLNQ